MKKKTVGIKEIGWSTLVMVLGALAVSGVISVLTGEQIVPESLSPIMSIALVELLVVLVCYFNVRKVSQSKLLAALLMAAPFFILRLFVGLFILEGEGMDLVRCLLSVAAAAVAGVMASTKKQRRR